MGSRQIHTKLLIIGAGPFGLSVAAHAKFLGVDHIITGKPMEFWKNNMPKGMLLRSTCDWHLDTTNEHTIDKFLQTRVQNCADVEPLSLQFYLDYTEWFINQKQLNVTSYYIDQVDRIADNSFIAKTSSGIIIHAEYVVVAVGLRHFNHYPEEITRFLPTGSYQHTCDLINMQLMKNKRVLIVGGRQSAFEWAALLQEAGADKVHISHRHASPEFKESDWSWVNILCDNMNDDPAWFRNLSQEEKDTIGKRLWSEGRLKIEPWLKERVLKDNIQVWPCTNIVSCIRLASDELQVTFDNDETIVVDDIALATGYKVNINNIPFLSKGNTLQALAVRDGFPMLDKYFQTNLPGLFITGMPASKDFGPFFGFTIAVRNSAKIIGKALMGEI